MATTNDLRQCIAGSLFRLRQPKLLAAFRIAFGALFLMHFFPKCDPWTMDFFSNENWHPHWQGFLWVENLPASAVKWHFYSILTAGVLLMLGLLYRVASIYLVIAYGYFILLDVAWFNNHHYLIFLFLFFFSIINAGNAFSLDNLLFRRPPRPIANWNIQIFKFQIIIVYLYASFPKMNAFWFSGDSIRNISTNEGYLALLNEYEWLIHFFAVGGFLFDLLIPFFLLHKKLRYAALGPLLFFHIINSQTLTIGVFPYLMIVVTVLFFDDLGIFNRPVLGDGLRLDNRTRRRNITAVLLAAYTIFQILFPFRHVLLPGNVFENKKGYHFAWMMKSTYQDYNLQFILVNNDTGDRFPIDLRKFLNPTQASVFVMYPPSIKQFAKYIGELARRDGLRETHVYCNFTIQVNNRPTRFLVNNDMDMTNCDFSVWANKECCLKDCR